MEGSLWYDECRVRSGRTKRVSSWDRTGGNADWIVIEPGATAVLADIKGPGVINHIYFTMIRPAFTDYRDAILRMYWDDEPTPSVEVPFGDFFCVSNCTIRAFASLKMSVNRGVGPLHHNNGYNCYFQMPFATRARIELVNESSRKFGGIHGGVWYHIDYEELDAPPPPDAGRFHAQWRRENLTKRIDPAENQGLNVTGDENYVILEAQGKGHIAGLHLEVNNVQGGWYGEGDDMIFIDGDTWPPSQHGTGTEEIFGGGACPDKEYAGPYTGFHLVENKDGEIFKGKTAMYRWYVTDPIRFHEKVRMTIEHGHANDFANDYSSVVYWYQLEPHGPFPKLPPMKDRWPLAPAVFEKVHAIYEEFVNLFTATSLEFGGKGLPVPEWHPRSAGFMDKGDDALHNGDYDSAIALLYQGLQIAREGVAKSG